MRNMKKKINAKKKYTLKHKRYFIGRGSTLRNSTKFLNSLFRNSTKETIDSGKTASTASTDYSTTYLVANNNIPFLLKEFIKQNSVEEIETLLQRSSIKINDIQGCLNVLLNMPHKDMLERLPIIDILIDNGADIREDDDKILRLAVIRSDDIFIDFLLSIYKKNNYGFISLFLSFEFSVNNKKFKSPPAILFLYHFSPTLFDSLKGLIKENEVGELLTYFCTNKKEYLKMFYFIRNNFNSNISCLNTKDPKSYVDFETEFIESIYGKNHQGFSRLLESDKFLLTKLKQRFY